MNANTYTIWTTPVPKPRMTQADRWKKRPCVLRYRAFADEVREKIADFAWPDCPYHVRFYLPIPKSRKDLKEGDPHRQRPDLDNLLKALWDSIMDDDCDQYDVRASKWWGEPRIEIELLTPNGPSGREGE